MNTVLSKDNLQNVMSSSDAKSEFSLPTTTRLGHVHLTVANLDSQITFYQKTLGMQLHWREGASAGLGAGEEDLLRLTEVKGALRPRRTTGLYHLALMYPSRKELARALARLFTLRYPNAPTDHGMSKSIYLDDAEGNTIELYILTLEDARLAIVNGQGVAYYADGRIGTGRDPLDIEALLRELKPTDRLDLHLPEGTRLGHVNLFASSLQAMRQFYRDVLGFQNGLNWDEMGSFDVGLDDLQPHIIAVNTWKGVGIPPAPKDALGIRYFTIELPDSIELGRVLERVRGAGINTEEVEEGILVRDPSSINVILTTTDHSRTA